MLRLCSTGITDNCGAGQWHQVVFLNMSDPSQQCPSTWREYNTSGIKACGRPANTRGSCESVFYPTGRQYSSVCGKVLGHQLGTMDGFGHEAGRLPWIDSPYVYGVSITRGSPRKHIWTYAAGLSEGYHAGEGLHPDCPCASPQSTSNAAVPSFVGDNYYCESGNPSETLVPNHVYTSDPLWDGEQCEGDCCSNGKSPPWFSVELPTPTTDYIEVRVCIPQESHDDAPIELLEIYVQ